MSAKLATLGLLQINVFWKKGYSIIISVHDATKKILSPKSSYIVDMVMWPTFGNSSISVREVIIQPQFNDKNQYFWDVVLIQVQ